MPVEVSSEPFLLSVESLTLRESGLEGTIPNEIFENLTNLKSLSIGENSFTGSLSNKIGNLKNLGKTGSAWLHL